LAPLCLAVGGTSCVVYLFLRRPIFPLRWRSALVPLPLLCVCLAWSVLSAGVAWARDVRQGAFSELFVAASPSTEAAVRFYTANGSREDGDFTMAIAVDGVTLQRLGPRSLSPGGLWAVEWRIPPGLGGKRILVSLERDGEPDRELAFQRAQVPPHAQVPD
jgi:hypothetical protein